MTRVFTVSSIFVLSASCLFAAVSISVRAADPIVGKWDYKGKALDFHADKVVTADYDNKNNRRWSKSTKKERRYYLFAGETKHALDMSEDGKSLTLVGRNRVYDRVVEVKKKKDSLPKKFNMDVAEDQTHWGNWTPFPEGSEIVYSKTLKGSSSNLRRKHVLEKKSPNGLCKIQVYEGTAGGWEKFKLLTNGTYSAKLTKTLKLIETKQKKLIFGSRQEMCEVTVYEDKTDPKAITKVTLWRSARVKTFHRELPQWGVDNGLLLEPDVVKASVEMTNPKGVTVATDYMLENPNAVIKYKGSDISVVHDRLWWVYRNPGGEESIVAIKERWLSPRIPGLILHADKSGRAGAASEKTTVVTFKTP